MRFPLNIPLVTRLEDKQRALCAIQYCKSSANVCSEGGASQIIKDATVDTAVVVKQGSRLMPSGRKAQ